MPNEQDLLPEPWCSFLRELDGFSTGGVDLHCIGGFVVTRCYGFARQTRDLDVLSITPNSQRNLFVQQAGKGSGLHKKYKVYLDFVTVIQAYPENYEQRLSEMFPGRLQNVRLFAAEAHDLALMKLERNIERDREDVKFLARQGYIQPDKLYMRYHEEMRMYVAAPEATTDKVIDFWVEMIREALQS
jgi:hypothetical protein